MSNIDNPKDKAIADVLSKINKVYGLGSAMRLDDKPVQNIEVISSGSISLDLALGVGGYPRGRIVEIYGPESSGKTTLTLHAIVEAQKKGLTCAFVDAEHAFDPVYAESLGVKFHDLIFSQPDNGEQALEIVDMLLKSQHVGLIVIDSVAALTPKAELDGEMGDSKMGLHARMMSQAMRKLTGSISKTNTLVIFINQTRSKIGITFGNPETTTGGNALKFYASQRLEVSRSSQIKDNEEVTGNLTKVKVIKNKVAPPFKKAEFNIMYGVGICRATEILDFCVDCEIVDKSGSWFSYEGTKLGQGKDNVVALLKDNLELLEELESKIMQIINPS
jgi:recombination protein RecA